MRKYGKFAILMAIIVGSLLWLATASVSGSKTYYLTIPELRKLGGDAGTKRIRVGGDVQKDSIVRAAGFVKFNLVQAEPGKETLVLPVVYEGRDPLPDTFKDGAQALAGGRMDATGVFHAQEVQAKCASKYAPKPGVAPDGLQKKLAPASSNRSYKL
jgi:cytochrome c-type biogenesis protein CcmE